MGEIFRLSLATLCGCASCEKSVVLGVVGRGGYLLILPNNLVNENSKLEFFYFYVTILLQYYHLSAIEHGNQF